MKTNAAVIYEPGKRLEIEELDLDGPRAGEVLIRYTYAGLCHSDLHIIKGDARPRVPMVLGHEGAGIVEEIQTGVTRVAPGDHVVCSFIPSCGVCRYCATGRQSICDMGRDASWRASCPAGRFPITGPRGQYGAMCMIGTFSQYGVIQPDLGHQGRRDLPLEKAVLVGCGVRTGGGGGECREGGPGETVSLSGSAVSGSTRCRAPGTPARRTSSPSTRWRTSARRPWSSARPTRSPPPRRRRQAITEMTSGLGADSAILTADLMTA